MSQHDYKQVKLNRGTYARQGAENRLDLYDLQEGLESHKLVRAAARGVALLVLDQGAYDPDTGEMLLATQRMRLRSSDGSPDFYGQRAYAGPCATAFLVSPRLLVTAGHFVSNLAVGRLSAVFGFQADRNWPCEGEQPPLPYRIPRHRVARVEKMLYCSNLLVPMGDLAVLQLENRVPDDTVVPLKVAAPHSVRLERSISMVGCPYGMPLKAVVGGPIPLSWPQVSAYDACSIQTNLDSFQNNSGSPVLDEWGKVIGVKSEMRVYDEVVGTSIVIAPELPGETWCSRIDLITELLVQLGVRIGGDGCPS